MVSSLTWLAILPVVATAGLVRQACDALPVYAQVVAMPTAPKGVYLVLSEEPLENRTSAVAWGEYVDSMNTTGWGTLVIHTNTAYPDQFQAYAAGYLEGAVTWEREYVHMINTNAQLPLENELGEYIQTQWGFMLGQSSAHPSDPFWYQVGLLLDQQMGLYDGYYSMYPPDPFSFLSFYLATMSGDLTDLLEVFPVEGELYTPPDAHGSAFIKPIGNASYPTDLYVAHSTWAGYEYLTRIYKFYDFPWKESSSGVAPIVPGRALAFSSYPGTLFR